MSARRRLCVALVSVLALSGFGAYAVFAASGKPGLALSASPSSQTVTEGSSTSYAVTVSPANGFTGTVTLSVSGLPAGAAASWSPNNAVPVSGTTNGSRTLNVSTGAATPTGSYTLTITGTSGSTSGSTTVTLVVTAPPSFSLSASPSSVTVAAGSSATYGVSLSRSNFSSPVTLSVTGGLPAGAAASFSPNNTTGASSALTVTTNNATTPDGTYSLTISGTGGSLTRTTQATLVVSTQASGAFPINGSLASPFYPGLSQPLNVAITNPNNFDLSITNLTVSVSVPSAPKADANHPCTSADYSVQQFSGAYPFKLNSGRTLTLSALGFPQAQWPQIKMLDRPVNQDGCKGASLKLAYTGTATKATGT